MPRYLRAISTDGRLCLVSVLSRRVSSPLPGGPIGAVD